MNILQITPQAPSHNSGGGLGVLQTLLSLSTLDDCSIDYIGPHIESDKIRNIYHSTFELKPSNNAISRTINLLHGITNARYNSWKNLDLNFDSYDAIVMDFTKLDYVLNRININKLFVRVHNVEYDYSKRDFLSHKSISKKIVSDLSFKQEKEITIKAHRLITLTEQDTNRLIELYGINRDKIDIIPVCLEAPKIVRKNKKNGPVNILITGSLWFGENANGVIWFLKNVLPIMKFDYTLTIAGAHPSNEIKKIVQENKNVILFDSPDDMTPFFETADIVVCPIFNGAGMKVKVAEALSYGIPVVGTTHAFIGYDISNNENSYIANSADEFAQSLTEYSLKTPEEKSVISDKARRLFENEYSISKSSNAWKQILLK